jgi:hypothetical protein
MLKEDDKQWFLTVLVLSSISITLFVIQRTRYQFLEPIFEFSIFHLSAIISVIYYLTRKNRIVNNEESLEISENINNL